MKRLPDRRDSIAFDGAEIRKAFATKEASVVHCTLPPKATSAATRLVAIHEIWYFMGGQGKIWLREEAEAGPGTCLELPAGVHFQYCSTGEDPLTWVCVCERTAGPPGTPVAGMLPTISAASNIVNPDLNYPGQTLRY
jgi:mannose-6-phosphate isomerase-like protein (cupin superfamily)